MWLKQLLDEAKELPDITSDENPLLLEQDNFYRIIKKHKMPLDHYLHFISFINSNINLTDSNRNMLREFNLKALSNFDEILMYWDLDNVDLNTIRKLISEINSKYPDLKDKFKKEIAFEAQRFNESLSETYTYSNETEWYSIMVTFGNKLDKLERYVQKCKLFDIQIDVNSAKLKDYIQRALDFIENGFIDKKFLLPDLVYIQNTLKNIRNQLALIKDSQLEDKINKLMVQVPEKFGLESGMYKDLNRMEVFREYLNVGKDFNHKFAKSEGLEKQIRIYLISKLLDCQHILDNPRSKISWQEKNMLEELLEDIEDKFPKLRQSDANLLNRIKNHPRMVAPIIENIFSTNSEGEIKQYFEKYLGSKSPEEISGMITQYGLISREWVKKICQSKVILDNILPADFAKIFVKNFLSNKDLSNFDYENYRLKLQNSINSSPEAARTIYESGLISVFPELISEEEMLKVLEKFKKSDQNFARYYELRTIIEPWNQFFVDITRFWAVGGELPNNLSQLKGFLDSIHAGKEVDLSSLYDCLRNNDFHKYKEYQYGQVEALSNLARLRDQRSGLAPVKTLKTEDNLNIFYLTLNEFFALSPEEQSKTLAKADKDFPMDGGDRKLSYWLEGYAKSNFEIANRICSSATINSYLHLKDFVSVALYYENSKQFPNQETQKDYIKLLGTAVNASPLSLLDILKSKLLRERLGGEVLEAAIRKHARDKKSIILKMGDIGFTDSVLDNRLQAVMVEILFNGRQFVPKLASGLESQASKSLKSASQDVNPLKVETKASNKESDKVVDFTRAISAIEQALTTPLSSEVTGEVKGDRERRPSAGEKNLNLEERNANFRDRKSGSEVLANKEHAAQITPGLDRIKNQGSMSSSTLVASSSPNQGTGIYSEDSSNHPMFGVKNNIALEKIGNKILAMLQNQFPGSGFKTENLPSNQGKGFVILTQPKLAPVVEAGAPVGVSMKVLKVCTVLTDEPGNLKFRFERSVDPEKELEQWQENIRKTIIAVAEAYKPKTDPIPYSGGSAREIAAFSEEAEKLKIPLEFDEASLKILEEVKKKSAPKL